MNYQEFITMMSEKTNELLEAEISVHIHKALKINQIRTYHQPFIWKNFSPNTKTDDLQMILHKVSWDFIGK